MMGVGKSTVGKKVAKKLKFNFIDIDKEIENKEKRKIKEIFKDDGEIYFRKIEKKNTLEALKKNDCVIALGGGAIIDPTICREVIDSSISIWLDLNTELILKRLTNIKKRPLLNVDNFKEKFKKIYMSRKKIYNQSNFRLKCDALNVEQVVNKAIKLYETS